MPEITPTPPLTEAQAKFCPKPAKLPDKTYKQKLEVTAPQRMQNGGKLRVLVIIHSTQNGVYVQLKYYYLKTTALEASKMKRLTIAVFETYIYGMKNHCMVRGGGGGGWRTPARTRSVQCIYA